MHIIDRLHTGGAERVLVTLANIFYRHGHAVTVITLVEAGPLAAQLLPGIKQVNLGRKFKYNLFTMHRLVTEIRNIDIVHVHSSFNMRYVFLASRLFFLQKPIFFHEHFGDIEIDRSVQWHQKYIYPKTVMICVSRRIYEWAVNNLPVDKNKVFILHNIIIKQQGLPARQPKSSDEIKLVMVSNIRRTKNIEFAIELLNAFKPIRHSSLAVIGKKSDEGYYNEISILIEKYGLTNSVHFIHDADEVQPLLHDYDIATHTAKSESGPLVLIEYLAQELPFLTYNTGETVLQVKDELPGCIANSFAIEEWITKIEKLLSADQLLLQQRLQLVFEKYFSEEAYYKECLKIYNRTQTPSAP